MAPNQKGMLIFLQRISYADQQKYRDSLFGVTKKDLLDISHRYVDVQSHKNVPIETITIAVALIMATADS